MLINEIKELLKTAGKYFSKEEELLKNIVLEDTIKMDKDLIKLLMSNENSKTHFFIEIEGVFVFDKDKFIKFIENKEFLPNSYTAYKNKIGLTDSKGAFIKEKNDVVLSWAYKDCYLEGGQDKEDMKKNEVFYNEILAPDEIDRLLEPKVLTNFKKYDVDGEHKVEDITMENNLIIKGNNLLALHSLKEKYVGKMKLIYIDPPYNTGSDSFKYNDKFNHSTWLTFMKNRLELARELLRDDGVIFVQCDDNEQAYLKVLMDEVFGRNQTDCMVWRKSGVGRDGKMKNTTTFRKDHEYVVLGFKNQKTLNKSLEKPNWENSYPNPDNDPRGNYKAGSISRTEESSNLNHKNYYTVKSPSGKEFTRQFDVPKDEFERLDNDGRIYWGRNKDAVPAIKIFENEERETNTSSLILFNGTSTEGKKEIENLFGNIDEFATPKPEAVMKKIIQISTQPNDIVLDYHIGSGTTAAVAHKMGRQYIGIEQMDYVETIACERLKKVIEGEQGGISKSVNWHGGGSFIYCDLMKWNENFIEKIDNAKNTKDLLKVYSQIKEKAFLNYKFDIEKFEEDNMKDFKDLKLEEQKDIIKKSLDLNSLYVNLSEIEDETYNISEEDKKLNKIFYNK